MARGLLCTKAMSVYSAEYHAMMPSPPSGAEKVTVSAEKTQNGQQEGFFHHLLDVINPLQHLPLVGTLYRAITGDHLGPVEKVMGDTLYGGLWGAVSSVADVAFEGLTGKSVEDTVLGWFSHDSHSKVAAAKIAAPAITPDTTLSFAGMPALPDANPVAIADDSNLAVFSSALAAKGVTGEMAQRALYAYRRSMSPVPQQPVFSSVN